METFPCEEWLQLPKSQEEMRNNKLHMLYKGGRNLTAKTVDGGYCQKH